MRENQVLSFFIDSLFFQNKKRICFEGVEKPRMSTNLHLVWINVQKSNNKIFLAIQKSTILVRGNQKPLEINKLKLAGDS